MDFSIVQKQRNILRAGLMEHIENVSFKLNDSTLFTDTDGNTLPINRVVANKRLGIYINQSRHCQTCIDSAIHIVKTRSVSSETPFILSSSDNCSNCNTRQFKILSHETQLDVYTVDMQREPGLQNLKTKDSPFCFILDSKGHINYVFYVDDILMPIVGEGYFNTINDVMNRSN